MRVPRALLPAASSVRRRHSPALPGGSQRRRGTRMTARNKELLSLVVVGALTAIGFASVYMARESVISTGSLSYAAILLGLYLVAHIVARLAVPNADPYLLPMAGLLTAVGVTEIYRLDPTDAFRQGLWVVMGVVLFALVLVFLGREYRRLESYRYLFGLTAVALLALPALPGIGTSVNGARLWVKLGPVQFQPGELAKICLIVFLAGYLREKREVLAQGRLKDFGPLLVIWGGAMLVLVETGDLGSALLFFGIFLAMLYAATGKAAFVGIGAALFVGGSIAAYETITRVKDRVTIWLHPWTDHAVYCAQNGKLDLRQNCASYQLVKSLYSIGNGGYTGTGWAKGTFSTPGGHQLIPYLNTDFIYSALAQELGLIGVSALVILYMLFIGRGFRVALASTDGFSKLLVVGLVFGFALQTFIIVGGVLRVIPLTGITLPFVSYGGSSILANFLLLALVLLVSNRANAHRAEAAG
jgi:cell division protein FtsW (lipid II flippase)